MPYLKNINNGYQNSFKLVTTDNLIPDRTREKLQSHLGSPRSVVLATYTGLGPSWSACAEPCLGLDHGQYQHVSLLTNLPYQLYMFCVCVRAVGMLEKFKLSWRLTAHQHPSEGLKNPSHHARPLNSLVSLLNDAVYGPLQLPG